MPGVAGVEMKYALKKAAAWGTAVAAGAGDGILCLPTGIKRDAPVEVDDSQGLFFSQDGIPGQVTVNGDLPMYLRYDGCDLLLALFFGNAGVPTQQGVTAAYAYNYALANNTDGLFATFVRNWKNYVEAVRSLKIAGLTIRGERGQPLQLIARCIGDDRELDGTNDATTFNNVTIAETANRVQMSQGVFRMNDQSDVALGAAHEIYPSSFELTADRKLAGVYSGEFVTSGNNKQDIIDEPTNEGMPEIMLRLQFPRHTVKTRLDELGSDTRKKADITFTGGLIEDVYYRQMKFEFPHLQMRNVDVVDESGIIKEPLELIAHAASAAPTGMTNTNPVDLTGINQRTTDPLA